MISFSGILLHLQGRDSPVEVVKRLHWVLGIQRIEPVMRRKPFDERQRGWFRCRQLPKGDSNGGASEAIARGGHRVGSSSSRHGLDNLPLECHQLRLTITFEQGLKGGVMFSPERTLPAELVAEWMRRIKMRAGNPAVRQRLGRRVGAVREQFWQEVCVRAIRASPAGWRDRLEHFGPRDSAREHPVRIGRQEDTHHVIFGREHGLSRAAPEGGDDVGFADPDARIDLQGTEAEIEQDTVAILSTQCSPVGTDFRKHRASAH